MENQVNSKKKVKAKKAEKVEVIMKKSPTRSLTSPNHRVVLVPKVSLMFNKILTSAHSPEDVNGLIVSKENNLSEQQVVVAVGPTALVEVGDWVKININMFPKEKLPGKHDLGNVIKVHPPFELIGKTNYLIMDDRHILYTFETEIK